MTADPKIGVDLREYDALNRAFAMMTPRYRELGAKIKKLLDEAGEDEIGESLTGVRLGLQPRRGQPTHDTIRMATDSPSLLLELAQLGAIKVDQERLKSLRGKTIAFDDAKAFEQPGPTTYALVVLQHSNSQLVPGTDGKPELVHRETGELKRVEDNERYERTRRYQDGELMPKPATPATSNGRGSLPATEKQIATLAKFKIDATGMSRAEASAHLDQLIGDRRKKSAA